MKTVSPGQKRVRWYQSLYLKVFLWFWLALSLAMAVAVVTSDWLSNDFIKPASQNDARLLVSLIERQPPIMAEGRMLWSQLQPGWNLVSVQVNRVGELPHDLEEFADTAALEGKVMYGQNDGWLMLGPVQSGNYLYMGVSRQAWSNFLDDNRRWVLPIVVFVVVTLLCFALVWSLTHPMRRLQRVVRQMSQGNFDVSELGADENRHDEIGVLIAEVASMAGATNRLLQSQRQLLRDVSHELRSPLTRLQMALGIARKKDTDGIVLKEHDRIERAVEQVDGLIAQILDLARLAQLNAGQLQAETDNPAHHVKIWLMDAEVEIDDKGLTLNTDIQADLDACHWDWMLVERAVDNLLRNAIRFSPEGGVLTLSVQQHERWVEISVQDQGPGVPDDMLERIFTPFTQIDPARSPKIGSDSGYGLGLALVYRVAELHSGNVYARNCEPGLRVTLRFPVGTSTN
ncbi:HAMP domain-containing sensor histidine kinase [Oceanobacter kriegii]|uniref:HAMP domain-containing sensor histidine kinase n=1 Tax=Oceanobacter kriegii TaxID=64972 RepID=UPI0004114415|nr:HAMP domain-containing sensor histidine kinase [Oceanobacter kriegii]